MRFGVFWSRHHVWKGKNILDLEFGVSGKVHAFVCPYFIKYLLSCACFSVMSTCFSLGLCSSVVFDSIREQLVILPYRLSWGDWLGVCKPSTSSL